MNLDAYAISLGLAKMYGLHVTPTRIHVWATRGKIQRTGRSPDGKTLYSLDEVRRHALAQEDAQPADLV